MSGVFDPDMTVGEAVWSVVLNVGAPLTFLVLSMVCA